MTTLSEARKSAAAQGSKWNAYQLTLSGLMAPLRVHYIFNLVSGLCLALIGHPWAALGFFLACSAVDTVQQLMIRRWLAESVGADTVKGFRRLAVACAMRMSVYLAPTAALTMAGGAKELAYFSVQLCSLIILAQAAGSLSRMIFWAYALPVLAVAAVAIPWTLPPMAALASVIGLGAVVLVMRMISDNTHKAVSTWYSGFNANANMVRELQAARDQAAAAQDAADRANEKARRANRAKANFLAAMSHDIRTPMTGVLGMAELLKRHEHDAAQAERLDVLIGSGEHLLSVLNDILDVANIDDGQSVSPAPHDLRGVLEDLVTSWRPQAADKGLDLVLRVEDSVPAHVMIDAPRVGQVLSKLIGNALKFTEFGRVEISVEAKTRRRKPPLVHVAVRDTGRGITAKALPGLFDRFSPAEEARRRKLGGAGLSLAIAKQLAEMMDGRIWVESEFGRGSTFHVELPLPLAKPQAVLAARPAAPIPAPELTRALKLLVVDDDAVSRLVLDQLLCGFGHTVVQAASGAEALELLRSQAFDLLLMDIQMPGMNGIETLETLRAGSGPNLEAPVVSLTADVTSGGRDRYLELGFSEHVTKPIQIEALTEAMARALSTAPPEAKAKRA